MALLPSSKRDQYALVFTALLLAGAYFGVYQLLWEPKNTQLDGQQARVDSLLVMNQKAKAELAQGKTAEVMAQAERYTQDLEVMRRLVPTGNEVPALLEQVSTAARRVGLDIADVQPEPMLSGDQYDAYKYRLSMRGNYHQIATLLTNIGSLQRIVAPINLTLASAGGPDPRKGKIQPLQALFEIQTYVARTVVPTAAPRAPKPGEN